MMQVIVNPIVSVFQMLSFVIGLTAITFIAILLFLTPKPKEEPLKLPTR